MSKKWLCFALFLLFINLCGMALCFAEIYRTPRDIYWWVIFGWFGVNCVNPTHELREILRR
jgi:hypothetical protein